MSELAKAAPIRPGSIPGRLTGAILTMAAAAGPGGIAVALEPEHITARILLAVAALVLVATGSVLLVAERGSQAFGLRRVQVTPWWIASFALAFGGFSLGWIGDDKTGSAAIISRIGVPDAVLASTAALLALTVGFVVGPPRLVIHGLRRYIRWSLPVNCWRLRVPSIAVIVYLVGLTARLARVRLGRYAYLGNAADALTNPSSLNQAFSLLEQFTRYGLILAALDAVAFSRSTRGRLTFRVMFALELTFALASGVKSELAFTLLAVAVAYTAGRGRVSRRAVVAGVATLAVLVPLNLAYREGIVSSAATGSFSPLAAVRRLPQLAAETYLGKSADTTLSGSADFASDRFREVDNLALIMQRSPSDIPFRSPVELLLGPVTGLVPRAVWPSKPLLSTGYAFSQEYYNLPAGLYTSSAVTIPGDLYRHGGWAVMVLGMVVMGMTLRVVEKCCRPYDDVRLSLFYGGFFLLLANFESDVVSMTVSLVQTGIVVGLLTRLAFGPVRS